VELNTEALAAYLKGNLTIDVSTEQDWDYYSDGVRVTVRLSLDGEVISTSSDTVTIRSHG
jgi:hypothetical protein